MDKGKVIQRKQYSILVSERDNECWFIGIVHCIDRISKVEIHGVVSV